MERFELITICYGKTFYELEENTNTEKETLEEIGLDETYYVFPLCSNIFAEELKDDEIYTISYINNPIGGNHELYEDLSRNEVLTFVDSLGEEERPYVNIFLSRNKINAKEYFKL